MHGVILVYSVVSFFLLSLAACGPSADPPQATSDCVACHEDATPGIVIDWELSTHSTNGMPTTHFLPMALTEAIRIVAALYRDGILVRPEHYAYGYPDLLAFHDAPSMIEQRLFRMHLEHRMRAFHGTFHNNLDYALWYGWSGARWCRTWPRSGCAPGTFVKKPAGAVRRSKRQKQWEWPNRPNRPV